MHQQACHVSSLQRSRLQHRPPTSAQLLREIVLLRDCLPSRPASVYIWPWEYMKIVHLHIPAQSL